MKLLLISEERIALIELIGILLEKALELVESEHHLRPVRALRRNLVKEGGEHLRD